ncbi:unnamed protein product [Rangifer tarandus platyrhynchus]|uniref:Uncharacterized protein n=1 Tax=Rangifer tarandus platyrhynchus TaxID=3082113 RepID=A0ABN8XLW7_RANTA|nr:unnamed protein product [Rangifer tarandus platyrhynchus]
MPVRPWRAEARRMDILRKRYAYPVFKLCLFRAFRASSGSRNVTHELDIPEPIERRRKLALQTRPRTGGLTNFSSAAHAGSQKPLRDYTGPVHRAAVCLGELKLGRLKQVYSIENASTFSSETTLSRDLTPTESASCQSRRNQPNAAGSRLEGDTVCALLIGTFDMRTHLFRFSLPCCARHCIKRYGALPCFDSAASGERPGVIRLRDAQVQRVNHCKRSRFPLQSRAWLHSKADQKGVLRRKFPERTNLCGARNGPRGTVTKISFCTKKTPCRQPLDSGLFRLQ